MTGRFYRLNIWHYHYSGLGIASELPLLEWAAFEVAPFEVADVRFSLRSPAPASPSKDPDWFLDAHECSFLVPEIAFFSVTGGRQITVTPLPAAGMSEIRLFLLASAWAALCYQRDLLPLHASVIQVGESAVAFCGESGAGKSSTAAWLCERGHSLMSDDLCVCHFADSVGGNPVPAVWPSTTRLKLWDETIQVLGWQEREKERDHFRFEKFHFPAPGPGANLRCPLPLRAIYLLKWGEPSLSQLKGSRALRGVVENATYRGDLLDATQVAAHWTRFTRLVTHVPVWEFSRPRDWEQMENALHDLRGHWRSPQPANA